MSTRIRSDSSGMGDRARSARALRPGRGLPQVHVAVRQRNAKIPFSGYSGRISIIGMPATGYRYLVNLPNVRGGNTIIDGTRIGVHDVVGLIVNGSSVDDVVRSFPDVTRAQVYECLAYYEDHRAEIDTLVARQMSPEL
jgi:uncharacterized protein (DUF433 family)